MSTQLTELSHPLAAAPAVAEKAARTGVWTIRPDQALRWANVSPLPAPRALPQDTSLRVLHALGVATMVLVAGLLGGVGAWALTP